MRWQIAALAVAGLLSIAGREASATAVYTVHDLGTLGGTSSYAYAINDSGQTVGSARTAAGAWRAFLYSGSTMTDLGTLGGTDSSAYGINNLGQIVGSARTAAGADRAFLYSGSTMSDLGTLGGTTSRAYGINNLGQIVGEASTATGATRAFLYSGSTMSNLGTLGGSFSRAYAINDIGWVVGQSATGFTGYMSGARAFRYIQSTMIDLGSFPGNSQVLPASGAYAVNDNGLVAGSAAYHRLINNPSFDDISAEHAVCFNNGLIDLAGEDEGGYYCARGVNNGGTVVGAANGHAFLYNGSTVTDLNNLIDPLSGWTLMEARDINNVGQIVGQGTIGGQWHAFLLTPVPEPSNVVLLGIGAISALASVWRRRKRTD